VGDELSALADAILTLALNWCAERLSTKFELERHFCVIAYGKLGGKELGYGSDLDIVFLYDSAHEFAKQESAAQNYVALVRRLMTWLTVKTGEGDLYEIDTALRPNGNSGMLVTSWDAYERYQLQRGSNTAWTWELQAMTRARCVFGSDQMHERFNAIRKKVLATMRDPQALRQEIIVMRQKLYAAYPAPSGYFDVKHSLGGMMDVEFSVQCLVLIYAKEVSELSGNVGNIALLQIAQAHHLLPDGVGIQAADAYQVMRDKQHAARLQEEKPLLQDHLLLFERAAIRALWLAVFET
jgi:glutamate-ammonia-ligase adenylyltransferase